MKATNFIYADISTYSPAKSISFYEAVFSWKYYKSDDYYVAYAGNTEVAGLYETPQQFKQMRMPHFWMSYIQVNNVAETVQNAKKLGGIIELETTLFANDKIALIRDPSGAGFTIYEGNNLTNIRTKNKANTLIWNELHVSDASKIIPFYQGVFNWNIEQIDRDFYQIYNSKNEHIADISEIPNSYKGKYEYWVCTFGVKDLQATKNNILQNSGSLISEESDRILFADNSGEAFFYVKEV
jgi:predicted enzyme related to lactoylglutathione lyase